MMAPRVLRGLAALVCALAIACASASAGTAAKPTTSSTTTTTSTTRKTSSTHSGPWVGVGQTVVVGTSDTGKPSAPPKVFTQFSANGNGPHTLKVPMSSSGFRNLGGLGTPPVVHGNAVWNLHLSGTTSQRFIADFPKAKLPVLVSVAYELNGKKVKAKDIVGKTGEMKVTYVITNPTTRSTQVSFKNVLGNRETTTVKAPLPVAADFSVTIPANFTNVKAPGASASGNGNGTSTAAWTLLLFDPLGGVKQSVTYQAHVTNAVVPSATLEAEVLPPASVPTLPAIKEPGAPAVPTVTLGRRLAALQIKLQASLANLRAKASAALSAFKGVAVPAVKAVSNQSAKVAANLSQASAAAAEVSTQVGPAVQAGLTQAEASSAAVSTQLAPAVRADLTRAEANASDAASRVTDINHRLEALPRSVRDTPAYRALRVRVLLLEARLNAHAALLRATTARVGEFQTRLTALSGLLARTSSVAANVLAVRLTALSTLLAQTSALGPGALSTKAAETANSLANAGLPQHNGQPKTIHSKQVGGGARLDKAFAKLDSAITDSADKVDHAYAYLTALDKRASDNKLPAGNATGATVQAGAFVYSISGANNSNHQSKLASFIGGFALFIAIGFGIGFYRLRRGLPSALKPPKSPPAAAQS
jgi:hypothetical protein